MKNKAFVIVGVIVTLLAGILNGQAPVEIRAASASAVAGWRQMSSPAGSPLWVAPEIRLTSADIARAEARKLADGGPAVAIVLTDAGAKKMAELSAIQTDKPIALLLDGQVIWAPIVRGAIGKEAVLTGGKGGLTQAQIDRLIASFKR
jgi:preprotein translocase subunit SecD